MLTFSIELFIKYDYPKTCYDIYLKKYNKWNRLNKLVSTKYKSPLMIKWVSILMISESLYSKLLQYLNNSVKKMDKNKYEVYYIINGKNYKMVVSPSRGPIQIAQVINEHGIEVTDHILPYMGPNNDWHNTKYNPNFFNYKSLIFELNNGDKKIFNNSETIILD